MSKVMRVACGLLAAGSCFAVFEMLRGNAPIASWAPLPLMALVFGSYAVRGRGFGPRPDEATGEPGGTSLDRPIPAVSIAMALLMAVGVFVVLYLAKSHRL